MTYENDCLALDKELAKLLGWKHIFSRPTQFAEGVSYKNSYVEGISPNWPCGPAMEIPRWTQDSKECFELAVEYAMSPMIGSAGVVVANTDAIIWYKDFPDKLSAVRFSVCQAVVNKLKNV